MWYLSSVEFYKLWDISNNCRQHCVFSIVIYFVFMCGTPLFNIQHTVPVKGDKDCSPTIPNKACYSSSSIFLSYSVIRGDHHIRKICTIICQTSHSWQNQESKTNIDFRKASLIPIWNKNRILKSVRENSQPHELIKMESFWNTFFPCLSRLD